MRDRETKRRETDRERERERQERSERKREREREREAARYTQMHTLNLGVEDSPLNFGAGKTKGSRHPAGCIFTPYIRGVCQGKATHPQKTPTQIKWEGRRVPTKVCSSKRPPKLEPRSVRPNEVFENL